jgi:hypothetical protein
VTTNENLDDELLSKAKRGKQKLTQPTEGHYYFNLQKRYMKIFLKVYTLNNTYWVNKNNVIDSDFDEEDINEQNEIEDMFNSDD